jgi:eukaryotic-like serine/threonine-protein kinase
MVGQTLGHYRIREKLGSGGMGEVYRARDERLKRDVAIKILSPKSGIATETRHHVLREAQSASALNHPQICTIYEVGEAADQDFIVMEFVEGHALAALISHGGFSVGLVLRYGSQIASALAHAHDRGVIHRDIKTSNIYVTPAGQIKILDFGLAKFVRANKVGDEQETVSSASGPWASSVVGTLPYMAPEVLRGAEADARSDIWALGVVLFEMVSGKRPFRGQTAYELSSAILREIPAPLPANTPAALRHIIDRSLEKEPGQRYQRASEVCSALEAVASGAGLAIGPSKPRGTLFPRRLTLVAISVLGVLIMASVALSLHGVRAALFGRRPTGQIRSLAVLPLENLSSDPEEEYFAMGMTDALITDLAKGGQFNVISRTSVMPYRDTKKPLAIISQELGVDAIVEGSVLESGNRVRITAQLIEARSDKHLWAERYERDLRDVLSLQDEVATSIATAIQGRVQNKAATKRRVDPDAYRLYLKGMYHWDRRTAADFQKATQYLNQATDKDPAFAEAYSALSGIYMMLSGYSLASTSEVLPKAKAAAVKALELDNALSDAHETLATVHMFEWGFPDAEKEFRQALALDPNNAGAHEGYGMFLARMGRFDEASAELRRAVQLEPLWLANDVALGNVYYFQGRYDEAIKEYNNVLEMNPDYWLAHGYRAFAYEKQGKFQEAEADLKRVLAAFPHTNAKAALGELYALSGKKAEARRIARELQENSKKEYVAPYWLATIYVALGDKKTAFQLLDKAFAERSNWILDLKIDPRFAALRSDTQFQDLLRRVGLPQSIDSAQ